MTYTPPNWTDPLTIALAVAGLVLLGVQAVLLFQNRTLSPGRKIGRAALNGLLWLIMLGYFLQLRWPADRPATHALFVGEDVPAAYARTVQDSLHIRERLTTQTLKRVYDSVTLVGQDFPTETLTRLSQSVVQWVPYNQPGRVQELRWKGVARQGEMQRVTGQIQSVGGQVFRIQYGNQTLDSLLLRPGGNTFALQFPVFGRGRLQTELTLDKHPLDTIRFYSRPAAPLLVRLVLDSPNFESKTLADWLGRQGHSVQVSTTLATNVRSRVDINNAQKFAGRKPDLVVTDPANAATVLVRTAIADGKAVLFINLSNPLADVAAINRALGTRWQVRKVSNQETVPAGNGLTAHPYRFANAPNQLAVPSYPVAVQQRAGRVGVSLLNETFPLALSGDSVAYSRVWYAIMAHLQPADKNNVIVEAPLFSGLPNQLYVNNLRVGNALFRVGTDTVRLTDSPLNRQSAVGTLLTKQTGWQPAGDSLAIYIERNTTTNPVAARRVVSRFVRGHSNYGAIRIGTNRQPNNVSGRTGAPDISSGESTSSESTPGWVWLTIFLICLTALWIEPKIT